MTFSYNAINRIRGKVLHYLHFNILISIGRALLFRILIFLRLCHHQYRSLFFPASSLCREPFWAFILPRVKAFKVALVHLNGARIHISFNPVRQGNFDLLAYISNWLKSFVAGLALNLQRGEALFGCSHQVYRPEQIQEKQLDEFHKSTANECVAGPAFFTLKLLDALHLVMVGSLTFLADNSFFLTILPEKIPVRLLVRELGGEVYKLNSNKFDSQLQGHYVTYLRFGSSLTDIHM